MLTLENISLSVGHATLLEPIQVQIQSGEVWAIVGPNGAGKSTLLNLISGIQAPTSGAIHWHGQALADIEPITLAQQRVYLAQQHQHDLSFTVTEVLKMAGYPWANKLNQTQLQQVCDWFDLASLLSRPFNQLSGGERQRVHLARSCLQVMPGGFEQKLLLLDEPLTGLDIAHQVKLFERIEFLRKKGALVVLVLHDINLALRFCTHCLVLKDGRLQTQGAAKDVLTANLLSTIFETPLVYSDTPLPHFFWA